MRRVAVQILLQFFVLATASRVHADPGRPLTRYSYEEIHMGVPWKITFYAADETIANRAAQRAFARVEQLNHALSDYDPGSELNRLSRTAPSTKPVPLGDDLWRVLWHAQRLSARTNGAFDVTVGPLTQLWRRARRQKELPDARLFAAALEATGYRGLQLDPSARTAQLLKAKMRLDLGGIGMGYAVDEALSVLHDEGIERALIDASGDIGASGPPPGERGWRIGIVPLSGAARPSRYVHLTHAAIATSGDAFQAVELNGKRFSHIVDPRTGMGLTDRMAITVVAPDCMTADSLATAVSVLGPDEGLKLVESVDKVAAVILRQVEREGAEDKIETFESRNLHFHLAP